MLTQEKLKEILHYSPETGVFTRTDPTTSKRFYGKTAGTTRKDGYVQITVSGKLLLAQRLAWLYVYGEMPTKFVDHRDQNPSNNRISNLRLASKKQNTENTGIRADNASGFRGVSFHKTRSKWVAQICHNQVRINIGLFDTPEEASAAYEAMRDKLFTHHQKKAA